jgi:hypothetical protein
MKLAPIVKNRSSYSWVIDYINAQAWTAQTLSRVRPSTFDGAISTLLDAPAIQHRVDGRRDDERQQQCDHQPADHRDGQRL